MNQIVTRDARKVTASKGNIENIVYNDVISMLDKLGEDVSVEINFNRNKTYSTDLIGTPTAAKAFLDEWLRPCGEATYCEGTHEKGLGNGIESHTIVLNYGCCTGQSFEYYDSPFEEATIKYSVKK